MKERLCQAFCDDLTVRQLTKGLAVSTGFLAEDGDPIGFYIVPDQDTGTWRIEDNGLSLPVLEAGGLDFRSGTRGDAMEALLQEYGVRIDDETREFAIGDIPEKRVPEAAMKFVAFMLRVRDFSLMTEARIVGTFRDDVAKMLRSEIGNEAAIEEREAIAPELSDFLPDFVLRAANRPPVGLFLGTTDGRVLEALFLHMRARYEVQYDCSVIALVERAKSLTAKVRQQALNRLSAVAEFRGDELQAIKRVADEVFGRRFTRH